MANDYSTRRPFTGSAPRKGEVLVPTFISKCMLHSGIDLDALETWHIAGCSILVGFVVTSEGRKPAMMKIFNEDVRNYIACGCPDDFCPGDRPRDNGHTDDHRRNMKLLRNRRTSFYKIICSFHQKSKPYNQNND